MSQPISLRSSIIPAFRTVRLSLAPLALCLMALSAASCLAQPVEPWVFEGPIMGTSYQVRVRSESSEDSQRKSQIDTAILEELQKVDRAMSTYKSDSEVSRFNDSKSTEWFDVSPETAMVVQRAQVIAEASEGAFDVTVGPLVDRWSFGPNRDIIAAPTDEEIAALREAIGWRKLEVRSDSPALRKAQPELRIDLSAIAKGFAVDQVARRLEHEGLGNYLVEVGGEVRCKGTRPDGQPWKTGIRRPETGGEGVQATVLLGHRSLATSGDYENFIVVDGQVLSHTIDPATGRPVARPPASVSIVAEDCMTADAIATAVGVLGYEKGEALARRFNSTLYVVERQGDKLVERFAPDFPFETPPQVAAAKNEIWGMMLAGGIVFAIALAGMAIGVMFGRKPIAGSCGGLASLQGGAIPSACDTCGRRTRECSELQDAIRQKQAAASKEPS